MPRAHFRHNPLRVCTNGGRSAAYLFPVLVFTFSITEHLLCQLYQFWIVTTQLQGHEPKNSLTERSDAIDNVKNSVRSVLDVRGTRNTLPKIFVEIVSLRLWALNALCNASLGAHS